MYNFEEIYNQYKDKLYKYICSKLSNKADAEDVMQEVFIKVYKNLRLYDDSKGKFYNFLLTNANQVIVEYYRRKFSDDGKYTTICEDSELDDYKYFEKFDGEYGLEKYLSKLPKAQREAIELAYIDGLPYKVVAKLLGKTELSIKSLIFRAKTNLRKLIEDEQPEIAEDYFGKKLLKAVVLSLVSVGLITGATYAIIKLYSIVFEKDTYTVNDVMNEISTSKAVVTEEKAREIIGNYLSIIKNTEFDVKDDLKLIRDYVYNKDCWQIKNENYMINIDSVNGKLISYYSFEENKDLARRSCLDLVDGLNLENGYELYKDELLYDCRKVMMCQKYGEIFNEYQSISIVFVGDFLRTIHVVDCDYEDKEILVDKEKAVEICKARGEDVKEISLEIENVKKNRINFKRAESEEMFSDNELYSENLLKRKYDIRKVWKIETISSKILYIDCNTGEIFDVTIIDEYSLEEESS